MVRHPGIVDRGLFHRILVGLVMQPSKPLSRDHGGVIVHSVLGIVDYPAVAAVEIFIILIIFVSIFVFSHKSSGLKSEI